jgi:hypothetical protein
VAIRLASLALASLGGAAIALAQVAPGDDLPRSGGAATVLAGRAGVRCVVWRDATGERAARARRDDAWFRALCARAPAGLLVVTVVAARAPAPAAGASADCAAGTAEVGAHPACTVAGAAGPAWFADALDGVVVTDADGLVQFVGGVGAGLADAIAAALAGGVDLAAARAAHACRLRFASWLDGPDGFVAGMLPDALAHAPHDGLLHALRWLLAAANDPPPAAAALAQASLRQLADDPRALATFSDHALRGALAPHALAALAAPALARAAAAAPDDVAVQIAAVRALGGAGEARAVGRLVVRARRLAADDPTACLDLAAALVSQPEPAIYGDVAAALVDRAAVLGARPRWLAAARVAVAMRCRGDAATAQAVLDDYTVAEGAGTSRNNDCWRWLTDRSTFGCCEDFAIALADRMVEDVAALDYFECDTVAFACLRAGRRAEAVAFAERAVAASADAVPAYGARLRWYRSELGVAAAAPR